MNKFFKSFFIVLFFVPQSIFAAELIFKIVPNTTPNDSATIVEVRIDPDGKNLNVVDGTISFQGEASNNLSVQVENGQSVLSLWPLPPNYIENEQVIRFTGGVPNGFSKEGLLFRMRLTSAMNGNLEISYLNGSAYLNDGKGTKEFISSKPLKINLDEIKNDKVVRVSSGFSGFKNATMMLLIVSVLFFIFKYGYKKIIKK
jgi:hypothetical protein